MKKIKYITDLKIYREENTPDLIAIKATGIAEISSRSAPVLVSSTNSQPSEDGIYQLDFILDELEYVTNEVEIEVDVVIKLKDLPQWVKGFKINAMENSDIELLS